VPTVAFKIRDEILIHKRNEIKIEVKIIEKIIKLWTYWTLRNMIDSIKSKITEYVQIIIPD